MSITAKKMFLFLFAFLSVLSCKSQGRVDSVWTPAYEQRKYNEINDAIKSHLTDQEKRKKLISYMIKRLKTELPNGLESVSKDSLRRLGVKIGMDYAAYNNAHKSDSKPKAYAWTPELEKVMRDEFLKRREMYHLEKSNEICDCIMTELKKAYPDSLIVPTPTDVIKKVDAHCEDVVFGKGKN